MKTFLLYVTLFICSLTASAQTIYLPHEVERQVQPSGGLPFLNQFIGVNLQIPFQSAINGVNGKVYIQGIVEPDGSMTGLKVTRGLDSLCNQEAMRVMSLYKAWQPALVKGEKVRQQFAYPVTFKASSPSNFDSTLMAYVDYYDTKLAPTANPKDYEYRMIRKLDKNGYINADVVSEQLKGKQWKELGRVPFKRSEIWYKFNNAEGKKDSISAYELAARDENASSYVTEHVFQQNGKVLKTTEYKGISKVSQINEYDLNGMLKSMQVYGDSSYTEASWYDNGQMKAVVTYPVMNPLTKDFENVYTSLWDPSGVQLVKDGEGMWSSQTGYEMGVLIEEGKVVKGRKSGKWIGKWTNGTTYYEEDYQDGILAEGTVYEDGNKRTYSQVRVSPKFKGGDRNFYKFLGQNIKYPIEASQRRISGRVQLSFVVCEDGSLCDYKVEKGVGFGLDDEALRVVKKMTSHWEPGEERGKKVRVKYNLPINFQLE